MPEQRIKARDWRYDRNVLEKPNVPNLTDEEHRFIEDMGQTMSGWGIPRSTGRIYGYLLLQAEPAGLDRIAGDLEAGKSSVSVGARQLVSLGLARSSGERGSRRVLYEALHTLESIFAARNAQANDLLARLRQGARAATARASREHLTEMAGLMQDFMEQGPELLKMLREQRRRQP